MTPNLAKRLKDIPGVAAVAVDLTESGGGINIRLEMGADEAAVLERVRELLAAYGARPPEERPKVRMGRSSPTLGEGGIGAASPSPGVEVTITPLGQRARIEVSTPNVRSFRIVRANPLAIAQGLSDAWCQVIGRIPVEIVEVNRDEEDRLRVVASIGKERSSGVAGLEDGWAQAISLAVGSAIGAVQVPPVRNPVTVGG